MQFDLNDNDESQEQRLAPIEEFHNESANPGWMPEEEEERLSSMVGFPHEEAADPSDGD